MVTPSQHGMHFRCLLLSVLIYFAQLAHSTPNPPAADSLPTADFGIEITFGCGPLLVQFINLSSPNTTSLLWHLEGANVTLSSDPNPVVQFPEAGVYEIQLIASNAVGSDTLTQQVPINGVPKADFVLTNDLGSLELYTTNLSVNATSFQWDFGDGENSPQVSPRHTYAADGTYTVTMVAFNECGQDTIQQAVTIITPPSAQFFLLQDTSCVPYTVNLSDSSSTNTTSWEWTVNGAIEDTSTSQAPSFSFDMPGTYTLQLTAENAAGSSTVSRQLTLLGVPESLFSLDYTPGGSTLALDNQSITADEFTWHFGNGDTSAAFEPQYVYPAEGVYTVTLEADNRCGQDTSQASVHVIWPPSAGFAVDTAIGCAPFTPQIINTGSANIDSWSWSALGAVPDTSSVESPVFTYEAAGVYRVVQTVGNTLGSSSDTLVIVVKGAPEASFGFEASAASVSFEQEAIAASSWEWHFGEGGMSVSPNPVYVYDTAGTFEVLLVAANACGQDSIRKLVKIEGQAPSPVIANEYEAGCSPLSVDFSSFSQTDSIHHWQWFFPGGSPEVSTQPTPTVIYAQAGLYPVRLIADNPFGQGRDSILAAVHVLAAPTANFTTSVSGTEVAFQNLSTGGNLYALWEFGDNTISNLPNPTHTYESPGQYQVRLSMSNSCGEDEYEQLLSIFPNAQRTADWLQKLSVYPNPAQLHCQVELQAKPAETIRLSLIDRKGNRLIRQQFPFHNGQIQAQLELGSLPSGWYLLVCEREGQRVYRAIVRQ